MRVIKPPPINKDFNVKAIVIRLMDTNNKYYTAEEVAEMLKVTTESVRRWIRDGKLKSVKLSGKFIRISQADLDEFVKSMRGKTTND